MSFYPKRWRERRTPDRTLLTVSGDPIQRVDSVRATDSDGYALDPAPVRDWLTMQGFTPLDWGEGSVLARGQVHSFIGLEREIEVSINEREGEVTDVYCRFALPRDRPPSLHEWAGLVAELCERFELRLEPGGRVPCSAAEFAAVVRNSIEYMRLAASLWAPGDALILATRDI